MKRKCRSGFSRVGSHGRTRSSWVGRVVNATAPDDAAARVSDAERFARDPMEILEQHVLDQCGLSIRDGKRASTDASMVGKRRHATEGTLPTLARSLARFGCPTTHEASIVLVCRSTRNTMSEPEHTRTTSKIATNSLEVARLARTIQTTSETAESIGERLARLRRERGITQAELAERLGLAQPNISDYERGILRLNAELILRLTGILKVSADEPSDSGAQGLRRRWQPRHRPPPRGDRTSRVATRKLCFTPSMRFFLRGPIGLVTSADLRRRYQKVITCPLRLKRLPSQRPHGQASRSSRRSFAQR